jgi:hypothetical protein
MSRGMRALFVLDGVLDVLGLGDRERAIHEEPDHIDAAGLLRPVCLDAIQLHEHAQLALLALVHRFLRCTEPRPAAGLHLDEDQRVSILGDDVDLTEAGAPVPREDAVSLFLEVGERSGLPCVADPVL